MSDLSFRIIKVVYSTSTATAYPFIHFRLGKNSIAVFPPDLSSTSGCGEWNTNIDISAGQNDEDSILSIDIHDTKADGNLLGMGWFSLTDLSQMSSRFSVDIFSLLIEKRELLGLIEIFLNCAPIQPVFQATNGLHLVLPVAPSSSIEEDRIMNFLQDFEKRQLSLWSSVQGRLESVEKKVAHFLHKKWEEFERVKVQT